MVDGGGPQAQLRPLYLWRSPRVRTLAAEALREPGDRSSSCSWVGLVDRDVQTRGPHGLVRAVKAPAVPELRQDGRRGEPPDAVELVLQCPTSRLGLGEGDDLGAEGLELGVEAVEHDEARLHRLA